MLPTQERQMEIALENAKSLRECLEEMKATGRPIPFSLTYAIICARETAAALSSADQSINQRSAA